LAEFSNVAEKYGQRRPAARAAFLSDSGFSNRKKADVTIPTQRLAIGHGAGPIRRYRSGLFIQDKIRY
jgi:hypothetical protein